VLSPRVLACTHAVLWSVLSRPAEVSNALCGGNLHFVAAETSSGLPIWTSTVSTVAHNATAVQPWPTHLASQPSYSASVLHGPLNGNTEGCVCFQGSSSASPSTASWASPQDDCCLAEQTRMNALTGDWSVSGWATLSIEQATVINNPLCRDQLFEPAPRDMQRLIPMDLNGGAEMSNMHRGAIGDTMKFGPCGQKCPRSLPACDELTGRCVVPTCRNMSRFCDDIALTGVRVRQACPETCGCDQPLSSLALFTPASGCSSACTTPPREPLAHTAFTVALAAMPCEDIALASGSAFQRYLHNVARLAPTWPNAMQMTIGVALNGLLQSGCPFIGSYVHMTRINLCSGTIFPIKPMAYFCPVSCGCRNAGVSMDTNLTCPPRCTSVPTNESVALS